MTYHKDAREKRGSQDMKNESPLSEPHLENTTKIATNTRGNPSKKNLIYIIQKRHERFA